MNLPPKKTPEREAAIVDAVVNHKHYPICWSPIRTQLPEHDAVFLVMSDALRIDVETTDAAGKPVEGVAVRVNVTAKGAQIIADLLDCSLLTGTLADVIWDQADIHIPPQTMVHTSDDTLHMMDTSWMIKHSAKIDELLPGIADAPKGLTDAEKKGFEDHLPLCFSVLISTVGKHWVIDQRLAQKPKTTACNYGWPIPIDGKPLNNATGTGRVIQSLGYAHNDAHTDYSQTLVLVSHWCLVDGVLQDLRGLLQDPVLAKMANRTGPMTYLRQASVPPP